MNARVGFGISIAAVTLAAGCGGGSAADKVAAPAAPPPAATPTSSAPATTATTAATAMTTTTCQTRNLSLALGPAEGTAGSMYEPLTFTNKGNQSCTLYGYPGVSFVTAGSGDQIGSPAARNPQHPARSVTLAPGDGADAVVQVVDHGNYGADQCKATAVSGFRVYPPGNTAAAYVPFHDAVTACSTDVSQLTVEAVARPTT